MEFHFKRLAGYCIGGKAAVGGDFFTVLVFTNCKLQINCIFQSQSTAESFSSLFVNLLSY